MNESKKLTLQAAKAAGIECPGGDHSVFDDGRIWDCKGLRWWNPLHDSEDAMNLASQLKMTVKPGIAFTDIAGFMSQPPTERGGSAEDTRRAIVRCAAEIGKAIP